MSVFVAKNPNLLALQLDRKKIVVVSFISAKISLWLILKKNTVCAAVRCYGKFCFFWVTLTYCGGVVLIV